MSEKTTELAADEKPDKPAPAPVMKSAERQAYPWMQGKEAFLAENPRNLPPMLRKAHGKHVKAAQAAKKGK